MSTVDEAVEAGAESASKFVPTSLALLTPAFRVGLASAWPILSAGLRELHKRYQDRYTTPYCGHCRGGFWPCPTITELDRIDRELGIGDDHQSGDPS